MFDQLFSNQWVFDRCMEGELLFIPLVIIFSLLILFILKPFLKKRKVFLISARILVPFIVFLGLLISGFSTCSAGLFWKGVTPAIELNNAIKVLCSHNECPKDQEELNKLDTNLYQKILDNAKFKYSFNTQTNEYTWYIQPSKYYIGIFQQEKFSLYKVPSFLPINYFGNVPIFTGDKKIFL